MMVDMTAVPLPEPNEPFEWVQAGPGAALVCRPLRGLADHLFTTRAWSPGVPTAEGGAGWSDVAAALGIPPGRLLRVRQVHGAEAWIADPSMAAPPEADIIVTDRPDVAVAVQAADCVPLLVADRRTGAVCAAHAGWRGLAARVPEAAVAALRRAFGSRPADLTAAIGPSIGACCYEVGVDVRDAFASAFPRGGSNAWFADATRTAHWMLDTWAAALAGLEAAGVPADHVFVSRLCTASHPGAFCSYRRDGAPAGRIVGAIKRRAEAPPGP
jgi:YfiH family protein